MTEDDFVVKGHRVAGDTDWDILASYRLSTYTKSLCTNTNTRRRRPTGQTDGLICQALIEREACIDEQWRVSFAVIWIRKFEYNVR